jgi:hypothetical protein
MNFNIVPNTTKEEISDAINYLLANLSGNSLIYNQTTGQITSGGVVIGYLYRYLWVKYATSFNGATGFSNSPANATYYGLHNTDTTTESNNPSDYIWTAGAFGATNFLFFLTTGGRSVTFFIGTTLPGAGWSVDSGSAIDLDQVSSVSGTNGLQGNQGVAGYFTNEPDIDVLSEAVSLLGQNPNPVFNTVQAAGYSNTGTTVTSTNALTTVTLTSQNTYFTGTAGASFAITLPAASSYIDGQKFVIMSTAARAVTTWISTGATFVGAPAALVANTPVCIHYNHANLVWYVSL